MAEFWERAFGQMQTMWGTAPTVSAAQAAEVFAQAGATDVLIPGIGYGRNAGVFLARGMSVTGIEISETAIGLARTRQGLPAEQVPIHHGSVTDMPFDTRRYGGIYCHGLLYLLDAEGRAKLLRDCAAQLAPGGHMVFTLIAKEAPMYGQGPRLGEDWYERLPGLPMYFYDEASVQRDFGAVGLVETRRQDEPAHDGTTLPFLVAICRAR